jgi:methionine synthase I (cobalamin-dependent)
MGTGLQEVGLPPGVGSERWCLEHPEAVQAVHAAHQAAGARWVQTNSFGANGGRLAVDGLAGQVVAVNAAAVRLAREGAPGLPVLGCLGPTTAPSADWERLYVEQAEALAAAGVDGYIVETVVAIGEGMAAVRAAYAVNSGPVLASYTPGADGNTLDGTPPEAMAEALRTAGAVVVGVNCGAGPESLLEPARRLVQCGIAPVLAAPNAGLPEWPDGVTGRARYPLNPQGFGRAAKQFQDAGVALFAGCCGVSATHLQAAAGALGITPRR